MTEQEALARLGDLVEEVTGIPAGQITMDQTFADDLDVDSLSMVEIAVAAQDAFSIEIPDEELKRFRTVGDVVKYVRRADAPLA